MYKRVKGTDDIYGEDMKYWYFVENVARETARLYGYSEIRTPIFERTELFVRGVGEDTDIVQKEMYTFEDKGNRSITLRPEGTAPTIRAFVENSMLATGLPKRLFYIGPMFRYERPQSGRQRQFHQFGVELIGSPSSLADAEAIVLADRFLKKLGLVDYTIKINSIGCEKCRSEYKKALKKYYEDKLDKVCDDCKRRYETNVLRLLDCKVDVEYVKGAPKITDYLCDDCKEHYLKTKEILDDLEIKYEEDPLLVRGLDYYNRVVFEIHHGKLGAQSAVGGGGRYDNLIKELGGPKTPSLGFAMGIERLIIAIKEENIPVDDIKNNEVYVAHLGERARVEAIKISEELRDSDISVVFNTMERGLSAQLKHAARLKCKLCIIVGENELERNIVILRNMETGEQIEIERDYIVGTTKEWIEK
ncbi:MULTISPECIES: histidine--tRNA ligase [unclassified Thermosipho (in: thermotogales)]|uniref:histidine--tRNA ligase n=1 Tax=unclassified Thermosipho (in: thermotogales) TaxID=2676525 RepID=UPI000986C531|nr:histidine--tRNA ligase [Thermosipho sp. 1223]MBT1247724.1 histidyl-tRNA synthetase [Thermosipho sp. 1244]OOC46797.1 histidyl-tRNA synthetase [Thermosipho sp. 1223]